jgi:transposase-like protein
MLKSVFEQPEAESVRRQYREVCAALDGKFDYALALLEAAETDVLAFSPFPVEHWKQIRSNNPQERQTRRSAAAPTWSGSSPTARRSSGPSAPSSPNNTTNGPAAAAI